MLDDFDRYAAKLRSPDPRPASGEALVLRGLLLLARVTQEPPWLGHLVGLMQPYAAPFPRRSFAESGPLSDGEAVTGMVALALASGDPGGEWHHIPAQLSARALIERPDEATPMTGPFLIDCGVADGKHDLVRAGFARLGHGVTGWAALALCDAFSLIDEKVYQDAQILREKDPEQAQLADLSRMASALEIRFRDMLGALLARQNGDGSWSGADPVTETALHLFILREAERIDIGPEDGGSSDSGTEALAPATAKAEAFLASALPPEAFATAPPAAIGALMMAEALRLAARRDEAMHRYFDYV